MTFEEIKREEYKAGKAEGLAEGEARGKITGKIDSILDFLNGIEPVSDDLKERLSSVTDMEVLSGLLKKSASVHTIKEFEACLDQMNL